MQPVSWKKYTDGRKNAPVRELLIEALAHVPQRGIAIDLGAGPMNDCRYLLAEGFQKVIAVDYDDTAEECAKEFLGNDRFSFVKRRFENFSFPSGIDLINAAYSLPFVPRSSFGGVIAEVRRSLKRGGIFCGQFFGDRDDWNVAGTNRTFTAREEVEELLAGMEVLKFDEEEDDRKSALGELKHWHTFHVIVRE